MNTYDVYLLSSAGMPRNHHALLVETNHPVTGAGHIYQVTGNIQNGMKFEDKPSARPTEEDPTFISKFRIGFVAEETYRTTCRDVCLSIEVPKKQFDGPKRLFPYRPLRRCQEWTEDAIRTLTERGVLSGHDMEKSTDKGLETEPI